MVIFMFNAFECDYVKLERADHGAPQLTKMIYHLKAVNSMIIEELSIQNYWQEKS